MDHHTNTKFSIALFEGLQHEKLLLVVTLLGVTLLLVSHFRKSSKQTVARLPIPAGDSWIWGHEKQVFVNEPGRAFRDWMKNLGFTFRIRAALQAPDVLVLGDSVGINHILQKKIYDYHHSKIVRPRVARLLGKGLGWVEGASEHKRMKRLVMPSLAAENVKAMSEDIRQAAFTSINDLYSQVQASENSLKMNILEFTGRVTLNVIGRVAFLHDFEGGKSEDAKRILSARRRGASAIAEYAGFLTLMLLRRFPILNDLPIYAIQAQGHAKSAIQSGVAQEMVKRNRMIAEDTLKTNKDLLSRLMVANLSNEISTTELYEQIPTFVISGHETTTITLGFSIFELARHRKIQDCLREEIQSFGKEPSYDDFQAKLPYLDAVLKETLRMYPGLAYMERVATTPDVIPLQNPVIGSDETVMNEVVVEPGQVVIIPVIALQRCEAIWDRPDEFRPERWLTSTLPNAHMLPNSWSHLLAFSDGPRSCIGMRQAIFQYKVILTSLISQFRFNDTGAQISIKISSSLQPWVVGRKEEGPQLPVEIELL